MLDRKFFSAASEELNLQRQQSFIYAALVHGPTERDPTIERVSVKISASPNETLEQVKAYMNAPPAPAPHNLTKQVFEKKTFHPMMFVLPYSSVDRAKVLLDFAIDKDNNYYMYTFQKADYTMREFSIGWWKLPENIWEQEIPLVNAAEQLVEPTNVALSALRISLPQKIKSTLWPAPARGMGFDPGHIDRYLEVERYYPKFVFNVMGFLGFIPFFFFTFGFAALFGPAIPELSQVQGSLHRHLYRACFHAMRYAMGLYSPFYFVFSVILRLSIVACIVAVLTTIFVPLIFAGPLAGLLVLLVLGVWEVVSTKLLIGFTYPLYLVWKHYVYSIHDAVFQKRVAALGE